jgi:alpha-tubulin suppressor-like RCC1 family protein
MTTDTDGDGSVDALDNCPWLSNSSQANHDTDDWGDACDANDDNDDFADDDDNCPTISNDSQADLNNDDQGDVCDNDDDGDGVIDTEDSAPRNAAQCLDLDDDGCDDCSQTQADGSGGDPDDDGTDTDGQGDCNVGDHDDDNDGVDDIDDGSPTVATACRDVDDDDCDDCVNTGANSSGGNVNSDGLDTNGDGQCNVSDPDDDGDGVNDDPDPEELNSSVCQDTDVDQCDDCSNVHQNVGDPDDDGDDLDTDGLCDVSDDDLDNDGVDNDDDVAPTDPYSCRNTDSDACDDCINTGADESGGDPLNDSCFAPAVQITSGNDHTCARFADGRVKCWGRNLYGSLGIGNLVGRGDHPNEMGANLPYVDLGTGIQAQSIVAGDYHTCAILTDGSIKCWGAFAGLGLETGGNRGDGSNEMGDLLPTVNLGAGAVVTRVAPGAGHTCAVLQGGALKCWGTNGDGELGLGDSNPRGTTTGTMGTNLPSVNLGGLTAVDVAAAWDFTCVLLSDNSVRCWGSVGNSQLGTTLYDDEADYIIGNEASDMGSNLVPVDFGMSQTVTKLVAAPKTVCALFANGELWCWGDAEFSVVPLLWGEPAKQDVDGTIVDVSCAYDHICAVLTDDTIKCWGTNTHGQLGYGDVEDRGDDANEMGADLDPVSFGSGLSALSVATGDDFSCALVEATSSNVKCWGIAPYLGLGINSDVTDQDRGDGPNEMGNLLPFVELVPR